MAPPALEGMSTKSIRPVTDYTGGRVFRAELHYGDQVIWRCRHDHRNANAADQCSDDTLEGIAADILDRYHKARSAMSEADRPARGGG